MFSSSDKGTTPVFPLEERVSGSPKKHREMRAKWKEYQALVTRTSAQLIAAVADILRDVNKIDDAMKTYGSLQWDENQNWLKLLYSNQFNPDIHLTKNRDRVPSYLRGAFEACHRNPLYTNEAFAGADYSDIHRGAIILQAACYTVEGKILTPENAEEASKIKDLYNELNGYYSIAENAKHKPTDFITLFVPISNNKALYADFSKFRQALKAISDKMHHEKRERSAAFFSAVIGAMQNPETSNAFLRKYLEINVENPAHWLLVDIRFDPVEHLTIGMDKVFAILARAFGANWKDESRIVLREKEIIYLALMIEGIREKAGISEADFQNELKDYVLNLGVQVELITAGLSDKGNEEVSEVNSQNLDEVSEVNSQNLDEVEIAPLSELLGTGIVVHSNEITSNDVSDLTLMADELEAAATVLDNHLNQLQVKKEKTEQKVAESMADGVVIPITVDEFEADCVIVDMPIQQELKQNWIDAKLLKMLTDVDRALANDISKHSKRMFNFSFFYRNGDNRRYAESNTIYEINEAATLEAAAVIASRYLSSMNPKKCNRGLVAICGTILAKDSIQRQQPSNRDDVESAHRFN